TYTFSTVDNSTNGANALPAITIGALGGSLTIDGQGATITRSGSTEFRFFDVNGGVLTLQNLTLTNGIGTSDGGALRVESTTTNAILTLDHVTVSNNSPDSGFSGGGIYVGSGPLNITSNSPVSFNTANLGAGIYNNAGDVAIANSTFSNNQTTG